MLFMFLIPMLDSEKKEKKKETQKKTNTEQKRKNE